MDTNTKLKRYLDDTLDRAHVYSVMLHKSEILYSRLTLLFKLPIILTSSALSIINSNFDGETMKSINIIFNIITAVILAVSSYMSFDKKVQEFQQAKRKYIKLSSEIEAKLLSNDILEETFVFSIIDKYNNIDENLDYEIPSHILKSTRRKYAGIKSLPLIINGIPKEEAYRGSDIALGTPLSVIPENKVIDMERKITVL